MALGGAMIWALDLDDFNAADGKTYPLLRTIKDALAGDGGPLPSTTTTTAAATTTTTPGGGPTTTTAGSGGGTTTTTTQPPSGGGELHQMIINTQKETIMIYCVLAFHLHQINTIAKSPAAS